MDLRAGTETPMRGLSRAASYGGAHRFSSVWLASRSLKDSRIAGITSSTDHDLQFAYSSIMDATTAPLFTY